MVLAGAITLLLASTPPALASASAPPSVGALDSAVFAEVNRVRARPLVYAPLLRAYRAAFQGDVVYAPGEEEGVETQEGAQAVDEALRDLQARGAAPNLLWDDRLAGSAADLAEDQQKTGQTGHETSDGAPFARRLARHAPEAAQAGEIISYGETTQVAVVRAFIVDDGVPDRAHRLDLFAKAFRRAGIACRPHPAFGVSCVVDLSS